MEPIGVRKRQPLSTVNRIPTPQLVIVFIHSSYPLATRPDTIQKPELIPISPLSTFSSSFLSEYEGRRRRSYFILLRKDEYKKQVHEKKHFAAKNVHRSSRALLSLIKRYVFFPEPSVIHAVSSKNDTKIAVLARWHPE